LSGKDVEEEGEYSMDELYDEYDNWETASESSDDGQSQIEHVPTSIRSQQQAGPRRAIEEIESDSEEEEDTPTPPNVVISRSPPLDITFRHPITHELSKREQYRRQTDTTTNDLSCAFVEQIEDVLCHDIRNLSTATFQGRIRLETLTPRRVSVYA
jgi:hypothetical protein